LARQIKPNVFLGCGLRYFNFYRIPDAFEQYYYSELKNESNLGIKFRGFKDTRNNLLTTTKGLYVELMTEVNFAEAVYNRTALDLRKYFSLGESEKHILAGRLYHSSVFGQVPFYDYSVLGGDEFVRGYFYGRFREQHLTTIQVEYRTPHLWRIGGAVFGGTSLVYGNSSSFKSNNIKPNLGAGLRILFDKKEGTNLRFDYAVGRDGQNGFYVSFGESF
jgi:outer membrane protein assembly factor BamA